MKRISTPCIHQVLKDRAKKNRDERESTPSRQTLDFLSQFARSYHVEPALRSELCGFVMN